ncbi:FAD-dependent oxidoreductase [Dyadobacter sp. 676]|uniref:FAD-dependent oxidoreductase n=1 Tax=Dyadobacter sp. 676 TaxID=3088362 RepID=A0AAU8FGV4_9BACT
MQKRKQVIVIGGGLAGLSTAVHLCENGAAVQLFEARACLGGADELME